MLGGFLRNRKMQKLLDEVESNPKPSPEVFVELVQMYREDGDYQAAARVAKQGAEVYPDSERILASRADMERVTRDLEKERLRQKIVSYPNPILYARLAELYKADGEIEASIRVCHSGISAFPTYGGTYLVLGEICMEGGDFAGARVHLEKAVELDKYNYTALKMLAQVYMQLGMSGVAARKLEEILYFAPGDESIVAMLEEARAAAGEPSPGEEPVGAETVEPGIEPGIEPAIQPGLEPGNEPATQPGIGPVISPGEASPVDSDVEPEGYVEMEVLPEEEQREPTEQGQVVERGVERGVEQGAEQGIEPAQAPPPGGARIGREAEINTAIEAITSLGGVKGAILVDPYGLVIAARLTKDVDEDLAGAMITNIYRAVVRAAEPMGIGAFEDGLIEGEGGNIHVMGVEDMILAVFADPTVKMGMLEKTLRDFADRVLD